jgi:hypothetical protein
MSLKLVRSSFLLYACCDSFQSSTVQHGSEDVGLTPKALLNGITRLKNPSHQTAYLRVRSIHAMTDSSSGIAAPSARYNHRRFGIDLLGQTLDICGFFPWSTIQERASALCQRASDSGGTVVGTLTKATASIFEWALKVGVESPNGRRSMGDSGIPFFYSRAVKSVALIMRRSELSSR